MKFCQRKYGRVWLETTAMLNGNLMNKGAAQSTKDVPNSEKVLECM